MQRQLEIAAILTSAALPILLLFVVVFCTILLRRNYEMAEPIKAFLFLAIAISLVAFGIETTGKSAMRLSSELLFSMGFFAYGTYRLIRWARTHSIVEKQEA